MKHILRRAKARRDLIAIYRYHAREAGIRVADRFLQATEATFQRLTDMPNLGTHHEHEHPALAELRVLSLGSQFKVYLVFYRQVPKGVEILRVLHGARDIASILNDDFPTNEEV